MNGTITDPDPLRTAAEALEQARHELLTVKEYAALRRVRRETVLRWIHEGVVEAERTAGQRGHWRIRVRRVA